MALAKNIDGAPLTFDVGIDLLKRLQAIQSKIGAASLSAVVRYAIEHFNFNQFEGANKAHKQLSVRLPSDMKKRLLRLSRDKHVSIGELLRATLEALPGAPKITQTSQPMTVKKTTKKKVTKTVKKTAKKKVAKKATKKVAKKKTAAKKK